MLEIDEDGSRCWRNEKGKFHRVDGPAYEGVDGYKIWFINEIKHRMDGPAIEDVSGYKAWYKNGRRHRTDGPAIEFKDGIRLWYLNGIQYTEEEYKVKVREVC